MPIDVEALAAESACANTRDGEGNGSDLREEVGTALTIPIGRPRPDSIIGEDGPHRLVRSGYIIVTACRSCGAPLTSPRSVALQLGPVCAKQGKVLAAVGTQGEVASDERSR